MISFIVIGKNEGKKLEACFKSIQETIKYNILEGTEIIYVDSNSTDNSIEVAKNFDADISVFQITGKCNAAVGRNVGAKHATQNILYFIDGDMEVVPEFLSLIMDKSGKLIYDFISGQFENRYYNEEGEYLYKEFYHKSVLLKDQYQPVTGGLFILKKEIWDKVGGMRTKYKKGQDLDLGLRIAKTGTLLLRKKDLMAIHHTINYKSNERIWKDLFIGNLMYGRGLMYREHLLNKHIYKRIIKSDPTLLVLIAGIILLFFKIYWGIIAYLCVVPVAVAFIKHKRFTDYLKIIPYQIIKDLMTIYSFWFFFPKNFKEEYKQIC